MSASERARSLDLASRRLHFRHDLLTALCSLNAAGISRNALDLVLERPHCRESIETAAQSVVEGWRRAPALDLWQLEARTVDALTPPRLAGVEAYPIVPRVAAAMVLASAELDAGRIYLFGRPLDDLEVARVLRDLGLRSFGSAQIQNELGRIFLAALLRRRRKYFDGEEFAALASRMTGLVAEAADARVELAPEAEEARASWAPSRLGREHHQLGLGLILGSSAAAAGQHLSLRGYLPDAAWVRRTELEQMVRHLADHLLPVELSVQVEWKRLPRLVLGAARLGEGCL